MYNKICKICNAEYDTDIINRAYCSINCKRIFYENRTADRRKRNFELYGTYEITQSDEMKRKISETKKNYSEDRKKEIMDKKIKTCLNNFRVECSFQSEAVKDKIHNVIKEKYNVDNVSQSDDIKQKKKETCMRNWGVDVPLKSEKIKNKVTDCWKNKSNEELDDIKQKHIDYNQKEYGVDYFSQTNEFKDKFKETWKNKSEEELELIKQKHIDTNQKKYNTNWFMQTEEYKEKIKQACQERYNVDNVFQDEKVKEKSKATCMERYGVENPTQNEEIFDKAQKNSHKWKPYNLPSGKVIKLQGYEWVYLNKYFELGNKEEDIIPHPKQNIIGKIWYYTEDGKKHRYFPDFYIPKDNKIIEVKSTWTYSNPKKPEKLQKNLLKEQSCLDRGFAFKFVIYNKKDI